jgi:hypothetical protein
LSFSLLCYQEFSILPTTKVVTFVLFSGGTSIFPAALMVTSNLVQGTVTLFQLRRGHCKLSLGDFIPDHDSSVAVFLQRKTNGDSTITIFGLEI